MSEERIGRKVRVTGLVQGVYFRAWTAEQAEKLGLDGWVRNEDDGAVSALITGPGQAVEALIELLHRGPRAARVAGVSVEPVDPSDVRTGFQIVD